MAKESVLGATAWPGTDVQPMVLKGLTDDGLLLFQSRFGKRLGLDLATGRTRKLKRVPWGSRPKRPEGFDYGVKAFSPDGKMGVTDRDLAVGRWLQGRSPAPFFGSSHA